MSNGGLLRAAGLDPGVFRNVKERIQAGQVHRAERTGIVEREVRRGDRNRHLHLQRSGAHQVALAPQLDGGGRFAPVRDALDGQTHGRESQHGRVGVNGQPLAVSQAAVADTEAVDPERLADCGQRLMHHERTLHEWVLGLVLIDQRLEPGLGNVDRPGPIRLSLEQFAIRQAQHSALRYDQMKTRPPTIARREEGFVSSQRPQLGPFGDQFRTRNRRSQPRAADAVVRLGEFHHPTIATFVSKPISSHSARGSPTASNTACNARTASIAGWKTAASRA